MMTKMKVEGCEKIQKVVGRERRVLVVAWRWCKVDFMMLWKRERKGEEIVIMMRNHLFSVKL